MCVVRHGILRRAKFIPMPTLYARAFSTADDHIEDSFSLDIDGIPFFIDNSVTAIISSQRILFMGPLIPTSVTLETAEGITTMTKLVGSMKLLLTDDNNNHHPYIIPRCLFDPKTPVKFWLFQLLEHSLVIMQMQLTLLQRMEPPSNWVPQNHTLFGIMAGTRIIICMALAACQNYSYMLVMAISKLYAPEYIRFSLTKSTSLFPQPII